MHFQKAEYENALIHINEGLDVFAAVMTMRRLEKANVFSFAVSLFLVICAASLHTMTSLPCCIHRLAVVRSVHGNVDLLTFERVAVLCLSHYAACVVEPDYTLRRPRLALLTFFFYLFFIQMRLNFTAHLQMVLGPVYVDDQVLAS